VLTQVIGGRYAENTGVVIDMLLSFTLGDEQAMNVAHHRAGLLPSLFADGERGDRSLAMHVISSETRRGAG
jgi:hypothetical protein